MARGTSDKDLSGYPYPISDWTDSSAYPAAGDLDVAGWAWEFLRRNAEYQRLWDLFDSLPDSIEGVDESGPYSTNKNGKWKGTRRSQFRFFEDGAAWYADPPPRHGERIDDYEAREPEGQVWIFAHYLEERFSISEPVDPRSKNGPDEFFDESIPPQVLHLKPPDSELCKCFSDVYPGVFLDHLDEIAGDPLKIPVLFDLRYPIGPQVEAARDILKHPSEAAARKLVQEKVTGVHYSPGHFATHVRLLDAVAAGASLGDIAARVYPDEPNSYPDYQANDAVKKLIARAKELTGKHFSIACKETTD